MNEYKATVKSRLMVWVVCTVLSVGIVVLGVLLSGKVGVTNDSFMDGMAKGFPVGLFSGFCAVMIFNILHCMRALTNDVALKKMYILENDERKKMIRQSALGKSFFITLGVLAVGIVVASFYNNIVTITMTAVLTVHVLVGAILKLYYSQKY